MTTGPAWPKGYALAQFETIDSTNEEAKRRALAGERGPLWISAAQQTAARGRRGRNWVSRRGNLAATLLIQPQRPTAQWAQLSFVAALAASDMLVYFAPQADVRLKWPNDVLADGRKISGILLESSSSGAGGSWLAIGIGINLAHHPTDTEYPATSLAALGGAVPEPQQGLSLLAAAFAQWYERWMEQGFEPVRDGWLARAAGLGSRIRARLASEEVWGVFEGLDENGALILQDGQRRRVISAGEVFFG